MRPYSLLPLLCLMSVYFLWRGLTGGGLRPWLAHALCTAALLYTHNWSWLVLGAQWALTAVCLALRVLNNPGAERRAAFRSVTRNWLLAQALVFTLYGPWLPVLAFQAQHAGHGGARAAKLFPSLAQFATIIVPLPGDYAAVFCAALAAVALWAACRGRPAGGAGGSPAPDGPPAVVRQTALLLFLGVPLLAFSVAVALNAKSLLLLPRCLTMLAPCALLVVAHAIASVPARPYVRLLAVQIAAVGLAYVSLLLLTQIKSNARELAAAVAAAARPTDLIVITPEQLGSSFNFYYKEPNDQINFPEQHRQEVTRFDDWVKRCGAPEALAATRRRISEARRKNQRVWLVVLEGEFLSDVPDDERKMPRYWTNTNFVGVVRSSQILQELIRLYGPPNQDAVPLDRRGGDEVMTALLFEPAT